MTEQPFDPDELAEYLDRTVPPGTSPAVRTDDDPLVDAALQLAHEEHPAPSIETALRIQAQLLAEANAQQQRPRHRRSLRVPRRTLALVASIVLILTFIILPPAVAASVPGEALYPVKRTVERVELAAAGIWGDRANTRLRHAERRAREALILLERDKLSIELMTQALDDMILAAQIAGRDSGADSSRLVGQTVQVHALLDYMVEEAGQRKLADETTLMNLSNTLEAAKNEGRLLLPATPSFTPAPATPSAVPTSTPGATVTATEPAPEVTATPVNAFVIADEAVNLRSGPGTDFELLTQLQPGAGVRVIDENEDATWLLVRLPDGSEGWIAAWLLYVGETLPPESERRGPPDGAPSGDNQPAEVTPVPTQPGGPPPGAPGAPPGSRP